MLKRYNPSRLKQQLCFERIKPKYQTALHAFETYNEELKEFLIFEAMRSQKYAISNTLLVFDRTDHRKQILKKKKRIDLLGYITILNDSIELDYSLKTAFKKKRIMYNSIPALKIGRLCVDNKYQRRGLGKCMLLWASYRAALLNQSSACRFLTLNAKRHEDTEKDSLGFYLKSGFRILGRTHPNKTGTIPMYLDIIRFIQKNLNSRKGE